jgi:hypothetical protein
MKVFTFLLLTYFVIFEPHYYYILAFDTNNNISLMNTSTKITTNRISYTKSFIVLSICVLSSIILCLYAIFHNRTSRKENKKSDQEQDLSTTSDSNVSISSDKSF